MSTVHRLPSTVGRSPQKKGGERMRKMQSLRHDGEGSGGSPGGEPGTDDRLAAAEAQAAAALSGYRELVAASPDLVGEMVQGSTIEEIDAAAETARQAY